MEKPTFVDSPNNDRIFPNLVGYEVSVTGVACASSHLLTSTQTTSTVSMAIPDYALTSNSIEKYNTPSYGEHYLDTVSSEYYHITTSEQKDLAVHERHNSITRTLETFLMTLAKNMCR